MKQKSVIIVLGLLIVIIIGFVYQNQLLDMFGLSSGNEQAEITLDNFTSGWRFESENCNSNNYINSQYESQNELSLGEMQNSISSQINGNEISKNDFYSIIRNIYFYRAGKDLSAGNYSIELTGGQAKILVAETCWEDDFDNILVLSYTGGVNAKNNGLPKFSHIRIPVIEKLGEFKILVEFMLDISFFRTFMLRASIGELSERLENLATTVANIESTGELLIPLNIENSHPDLTWRDVDTVILAISGHGKLVLGPPTLIY